jgi:hypothetical protein
MLYKIAAVAVILMAFYETVEYFHIDALLP